MSNSHLVLDVNPLQGCNSLLLTVVVSVVDVKPTTLKFSYTVTENSKLNNEQGLLLTLRLPTSTCHFGTSTWRGNKVGCTAVPETKVVLYPRFPHSHIPRTFKCSRARWSACSLARGRVRRGAVFAERAVHRRISRLAAAGCSLPCVAAPMTAVERARRSLHLSILSRRRCGWVRPASCGFGVARSTKPSSPAAPPPAAHLHSPRRAAASAAY